MALAYTKDFLIEAYAYRFLPLGYDVYKKMTALAEPFYDKVGKDKFRTYASLDAEAIREYKSYLNQE